MKKMFSLALALIMALALCVPAFAVETEKDSMNSSEYATTEGSITVTNAKEGETYSVYRIFDLESYNNESGAFSYKINETWGDWAKTMTAYVKVDEQGYVTWVENASAADFAVAALAFAKTEGAIVAAEVSKTATADGALTFDDLALGYYLIDSSLGTLCSLDTTNNNVNVIEKNSVPYVEKQVQEDSKIGDQDEWGEQNNADIGQIVNFKSTISIPAWGAATDENDKETPEAKEDLDAKPTHSGIQNLILHDVMEANLEFDATSVVVVADGTDELTAYVSETAEWDYKLVTDATDGCTFEVVFNQEYLDTLTPEAHTFVVTYSAELVAVADEDETEADTPYENKTQITYGDSSESEWDTTYTKTYDFDLLKYTNGTEGEVQLNGAEFELTYADANGGYDEDAAPIAFVAVDGGYRVATADDEDKTTILAAGSINILGLDADVYYLTETKAPDGYNQLAEPVRIEITDDSATLIANPDYGKEGAATADQAYIAAANDLVKVLNLTGAELPSTGGVGTTIFYVIGGVLMVGAAVLLVTKKKLANEQ